MQINKLDMYFTLTKKLSYYATKFNRYIGSMIFSIEDIFLARNILVKYLSKNPDMILQGRVSDNLLCLTILYIVNKFINDECLYVEDIIDKKDINVFKILEMDILNKIDYRVWIIDPITILCDTISNSNLLVTNRDLKLCNDIFKYLVENPATIYFDSNTIVTSILYCISSYYRWKRQNTLGPMSRNESICVQIIKSYIDSTSR